MVRPRRFRQVVREPDATYFKPRGVPLIELEEVALGVDELEALRLVDGEGLNQIDAAGRMKISQPTLNRLLAGGREKVAKALANGFAIKIEGGHYKVR